MILLASGFSLVLAAVEEVILSVEGMTCPLCARGIEASVGRLPDVLGVEASVGTGRVRVWASEDHSLVLDAIRTRILRAGFRAVGEPIVRVSGVIRRGPRDRLTFQVSESNERYDLLEGEEFRNLMLALPDTGRTRIAVTGRIHKHPERLPPSLSILNYEVRGP